MRRIILGLAAKDAESPDEAMLVARDLGLHPRGTPEGARRLLGIAPTALAMVGQLGGLPHMRTAIETATADEISAARAVAYLTLTGVGPMATVLASAVGLAPDELLLGSADPLLPGDLALVIAFLVASFRRAAGEDVVQIMGPQPPLPLLQEAAERLGRRSDRALVEDLTRFISGLQGGKRDPSSTERPRKEVGET
jgi:hypothetical protein